MNNPVSSFIDIQVITWLKDTHGLFDYESKHINLKKHRIENPSNIYREHGNIIFKDHRNPALTDNVNNDVGPVISLCPDQAKRGCFRIVPNVDDGTNQGKDNAFLVVRSVKDENGNQKGYELEVGDVMRFGRIEYRVLEYRDDKAQVHSIFADSKLQNECCENLKEKDCPLEEPIKKQCRICLMDEQDSTEALVNPCNCKGTSGYIHINCLQNWIITKMRIKEKPEIKCSYWKKLDCEVCKALLPYAVKIGQEKVELVPIERPETPYILLERLFYNETRETSGDSKMLILLNTINPQVHITLGRGQECDIRENDISVSRLHGFLKFQNGKFSVFDNNSKFGTLVKLRKIYPLERKKIAIQIGGALLALSVKRVFPISAKPMSELLRERVPKQQMIKEPEGDSPELNMNECSQELEEKAKEHPLC